ncbi:MAG: 5-(carboxyamino)imidazole ribonucleotide mutase [Deltaproteobacteria bacterium]|nr:5-(carboxyamino)imidazole ribonucleotide mutase [Deltaproteobacteria bacterium]MBI3296373.1 5-(carboxyamino)imidazole ribonucleotide mutase [Deltaproteobacteria bacterium]
MKVLILTGSSSDEQFAVKCSEVLKTFEVSHRYSVASAHRSPKRVLDILDKLGPETKVIIAMAGHAAHLAGVIASKTVLPVIGVPLPSSDLNGMDSLLSTAQMPGGIPVATMGIGDSGAQNAAVLAVEILATHDQGLTERLQTYRRELSEMLEKSAVEIEKRWKQ